MEPPRAVVLAGRAADALADRTLLELQALIRPAEDLALYRADMADWPGQGELAVASGAARLGRANDACRRDILKRLKAKGPLPMRELPDTCAVPWGSTGWTNNRNVEKMLDLMVARGEVAVAGRQGTERLWDLASRVYPDDPVVPAEGARASGTSGGCAPSASPEPARRRARWSRGTWARWASPPSSTG